MSFGPDGTSQSILLFTGSREVKVTVRTAPFRLTHLGLNKWAYIMQTSILNMFSQTKIVPRVQFRGNHHWLRYSLSVEHGTNHLLN